MTQPIRTATALAATSTATSGTSTAAIPLGTSSGYRVAFWATGNTAFVRFGSAEVVAAVVTDYPIAVGTPVEFWIPLDVTHYRAIAAGVGTINHLMIGAA